MKQTLCDICKKTLEARHNIGDLPCYTYDGHGFLYLEDLCADCYNKIDNFVRKMKTEGG